MYKSLIICGAFAAWFLLNSALVCAQEVRFARIGVKDGLSQGSVFSICQDYQGLMWLGTRDGLNCYDTQKFTVYRNIPADSASLFDNNIHALFEDAKHRLWVGTTAGLNLFDRNTGTFKRLYVGKTLPGNGEREPSFSSITEDAKGHVWFGSNRGLFRLKEGKQPSLELLYDLALFPGESLSPATRNVHHVDVDDEGRFWLSTEGGVVCLRPSGAGEGLSIWRIYTKENGKLNDNHVRFASIVKPGLVWVGTKEGGINEIDVSSGRVRYLMTKSGSPTVSLAHNDVRSLLKDRKGGFWIGTFGGLNYYTWKDGFVTYRSADNDPFSLSNNSIRPLFQDRRGSIWIGTFYGGVSIADHYLPQFTNYSKAADLGGLSYNVVSSLLEDPAHHLWIGTEGGGINLYDKRTGKIKKFTHNTANDHSLSHDNVKAMCMDAKGNLWVGTYQGGLNFLEKGSSDFQHFKHDSKNPHSLANDNVYALAVDVEGSIWAGTYGGGVSCLKNRADPDFETYTSSKTGKYHLSSNQVHAILSDSQGNLWVGTENGLNVKWKGKPGFEVFRHSLDDPHSVGSDLIISLFEDRYHHLWVGTLKGGLNRFDPKKRNFVRYGPKSGLYCSNVLAMADDRKGRLWLSTTNGIYRFDPKNGQAKLYNTKDGLLSNEFTIGAVCQMQDGQLAFGGTNGFTSFQPDRFSNSDYRPPAIFTAFKLFNKEVLPGEGSPLMKPIAISKKLVLDHHQRTFTVDFAVLNYILPDKNQYAYRLEGLETDWNVVNTASATYTSLAPGQYTLLVKGASNDGVWSEKPARLEIKIKPAPWQTGWAYLLYGCILTAIGVTVFRYMHGRSLLKHQLQLEHLEMERQKEISEIKLNFFTQVSHELRTPLTLILSPLQRLLAKKRAMEDDEREILGTIQQNADRLMQLVNQLLDFRKQENGQAQLRAVPGDITAFLQQICQSFTFLAAGKGVQFEYLLPEQPVRLTFDPDLLNKVMTNLLANAFKFTKAKGNVRLNLTQQPSDKHHQHGFVQIQVWDDGEGIPEDKLTEIFEWYFQLHPGGGPEGQTGTGIGLALSKKLVELHGGSIYAASNLGKSDPVFTCFTIEIPENVIPMVPDASADIPVALTLATKDSHLIASGAGRKPAIVLAEDHEGVRQEVVQCLGTQYEIHEAADGTKAWDLIRQELPDLVITDLMMPGYDGMALLKLIKQDVSTNHIPVLILTARSAEAYLLQGLEAGCDDFLQKPFHAQVLTLKVYNMLEARERFRQKFTRQMIGTPDGDEGRSPAVEFLKGVIQVVEQYMEDTDFNVQVLASKAGISRAVLYRKVKQLTGMNIVELISLIRLRKAAALILCEGLQSNEVAYRVGFNDPKYFAKSFKAFYGMTPKEYAMGMSNKHVEEAGHFIHQLLVPVTSADHKQEP